jgi:hypothetical protein
MIMWTALVGPIADLAGTWLNGKVEKQKAKNEVAVATAKAEATVMQKKATGEIDWDLKMADASASSWKDEWLTIIFSVPLWYQYTLGVIVAASFGVRSAAKFFGKK